MEKELKAGLLGLSTEAQANIPAKLLCVPGPIHNKISISV